MFHTIPLIQLFVDRQIGSMSSSDVDKVLVLIYLEVTIVIFLYTPTPLLVCPLLRLLLAHQMGNADKLSSHEILFGLY